MKQINVLIEDKSSLIIFTLLPMLPLLLLHFLLLFPYLGIQMQIFIKYCHTCKIID